MSFLKKIDLKTQNNLVSLISISFIFSGATLSYISSIYDSNLCNILSFLISFLINTILIFKFNYLKKTFEIINKKYIVISGIFSLLYGYSFVIQYSYHISKKINSLLVYFHINPEYIWQLKIALTILIIEISLLALFVYLYSLIRYIFPAIFSFFKSLSKGEIYFIIICTTIVLIFCSVLYSKSNAFYKPYYFDKNGVQKFLHWNIIYGFDTPNELELNIFIAYKSIKHILFSLVAFPIALFSQIISSLLFFWPTSYYIFTQGFNILLINITAILLKRLLNSKLILPLFTLSHPILILYFNFTRYHISLFFLVLSVYCFINYNLKSYAIPGILASGMTSSSIYIIPFITRYKNLKQYLYDLFKYIIVFLTVIKY